MFLHLSLFPKILVFLLKFQYLNILNVLDFNFYQSSKHDQPLLERVKYYTIVGQIILKQLKTQLQKQRLLPKLLLLLEYSEINVR